MKRKKKLDANSLRKLLGHIHLKFPHHCGNNKITKRFTLRRGKQLQCKSLFFARYCIHHVRTSNNRKIILRITHAILQTFSVGLFLSLLISRPSPPPNVFSWEITALLMSPSVKKKKWGSKAPFCEWAAVCTSTAAVCVRASVCTNLTSHGGQERH